MGGAMCCNAEYYSGDTTANHAGGGIGRSQYASGNGGTVTLAGGTNNMALAPGPFTTTGTQTVPGGTHFPEGTGDITKLSLLSLVGTCLQLCLLVSCAPNMAVGMVSRRRR